MSTESVKGSNEDALTSNSDPVEGDITNPKPESPSADSDNETKIKADSEEHEKKSTPRSPMLVYVFFQKVSH